MVFVNFCCILCLFIFEKRKFCEYEYVCWDLDFNEVWEIVGELGDGVFGKVYKVRVLGLGGRGVWSCFGRKGCWLWLVLVLVWEGVEWLFGFEFGVLGVCVGDFCFLGGFLFSLVE